MNKYDRYRKELLRLSHNIQFYQHKIALSQASNERIFYEKLLKKETKRYQEIQLRVHQAEMQLQQKQPTFQQINKINKQIKTMEAEPIDVIPTQREQFLLDPIDFILCQQQQLSKKSQTNDMTANHLESISSKENDTRSEQLERIPRRIVDSTPNQMQGIPRNPKQLERIPKEPTDVIPSKGIETSQGDETNQGIEKNQEVETDQRIETNQNNEMNQDVETDQGIETDLDIDLNQENEANQMEGRVFSIEELAQYNGKNGQPAYVAVNGIVYDVSRIGRWAGGNHFSLTAGQNLTANFNRCHVGNLQVLGRLPIVGTLQL